MIARIGKELYGMMMPLSNKIIIGNWKQNGDLDTVLDFMMQLRDQINAKALPVGRRVILCPPYPYLMHLNAQLSGTGIAIGAQDISESDHGSRTGDVNGAMLGDLGAKIVLVGHSERRQHHKEDHAVFIQKIKQAVKYNLTFVYCIGETHEDYELQNTKHVLEEQLSLLTVRDFSDHDLSSHIMIAYEPRWAIGSGQVPSPQEIEDHLNIIKNYLGDIYDSTVNVPVLYGGSVNADNAKTILQISNLDGVLVGGASLDARTFYEIIQS